MSERREIGIALHRLGNLLAVILAGTETLLTGDGGPERQRESLEAIRRAAISARERLREMQVSIGPEPSIREETAVTAVAPLEPPLVSPEPRQPAGMAPPTTGEVRSVLLIEDNPDVRTALERLLRRCDYEVEAVASGVEGVGRYRTRRFDCVLTDLDMPGFDGLMVSRVIKDHDPGAFVVLLTGANVEIASPMLAAAGVDAVEWKPVSLERVRSLRAGRTGRARAPDGPTA